MYIYIYINLFRSYVFDDMITYHQNNKINEIPPISIISASPVNVKRLSVSDTFNYNSKTDLNNKCRLCDKNILSMEGMYIYICMCMSMCMYVHLYIHICTYI
jgi:hypothetical protein